MKDRNLTIFISLKMPYKVAVASKSLLEHFSVWSFDITWSQWAGHTAQLFFKWTVRLNNSRDTF